MNWTLRDLAADQFSLVSRLPAVIVKQIRLYLICGTISHKITHKLPFNEVVCIRHGLVLGWNSSQNTKYIFRIKTRKVWEVDHRTCGIYSDRAIIVDTFDELKIQYLDGREEALDVEFNIDAGRGSRWKVTGEACLCRDDEAVFLAHKVVDKDGNESEIFATGPDYDKMIYKPVGEIRNCTIDGSQFEVRPTMTTFKNESFGYGIGDWNPCHVSHDGQAYHKLAVFFPDIGFFIFNNNSTVTTKHYSLKNNMTNIPMSFIIIDDYFFQTGPSIVFGKILFTN